MPDLPRSTDVPKEVKVPLDSAKGAIPGTVQLNRGNVDLIQIALLQAINDNLTELKHILKEKK